MVKRVHLDEFSVNLCVRAAPVYVCTIRFIDLLLILIDWSTYIFFNYIIQMPDDDGGGGCCC